MRIALTYDRNQELKPLDQAEIIGIIDEEKKEVEQYENPGIGSKEATMAVILDLNADAIVVRQKFLCPGSYMMSYGRLKYMPTGYNNLKEVLEHLEEIKKNVKEELDEEMYAEEMEY
ncbi:hypothetical protein BFU36_09175 [Sulfolobus sp. A20]|uniref:hypothetical protein n=1 Tax=Saccharolobus sp. A20 TaxID=1891280 RepID=UPI00084624C1|nr:hypothetical protein [Sulfolobus sp. A20]TRM78130.1 hypothetical protein DJ528_05335 [Sulfolobus sp. B5]TRM78789.1 hypothetical protein DJ532_00415 [Sulfolobus sp. A20-N-F8]TRM82016.1 hypothetical protein DJ524_02055 [Sulfolobus sp. D5]TRM83528.1 hypothetical protein DJ531_05190 [Sulfolobus sp. A20-N-F6]TRM88115.1 hypothetical protein DJ529_06235 [Sulfolobus sp. C3]TRM92623.1 hypothetical protein DJ526_05470 [Sulfolobus sp. A20-N-G8]TRN00389.1 hypothetical protein DJ527_07085 [Sulfolobus 